MLSRVALKARVLTRPALRCAGGVHKYKEKHKGDEKQFFNKEDGK